MGMHDAAAVIVGVFAYWEWKVLSVFILLGNGRCCLRRCDCIPHTKHRILCTILCFSIRYRNHTTLYHPSVRHTPIHKQPHLPSPISPTQPTSSHHHRPTRSHPPPVPQTSPQTSPAQASKQNPDNADPPSPPLPLPPKKADLPPLRRPLPCPAAWLSDAHSRNRAPARPAVQKKKRGR